MPFVSEEYTVPKGQGSYMKFEQGENKFRILSDAITGHEGWDKSGEKPKVFRSKRTDDEKLDRCDEVKPFMAFKVWNYATKSIQILSLTQKTIIEQIVNYSRDPDWGDPNDPTTGYGFVVTKSGSGLNTEYQIRPGKSQPVTDDIVAAEDKVLCNLEALFDDGDPFASNAPATQSEDDIPF